MPDTSSDQWIGKVLDGRYRVERYLGGGGMGQVFEGLQVELGRRVALKLLRPELAREQVFLERFRREARAAGHLGNPHIVDVTDLVLPDGDDEPPFLVMELLKGESLMDVLTRDGKLELSRAVRIAIQLLDALAEAHAAEIVHRDIKPPNVFLVGLGGGDELAKLLDFGIAKLQLSPASQRLTAAGAIVGTPQFAAPEQLTGKGIDARTDVYGLGVLLFGMLAGRPPFTGPVDSLIPAILGEEAVDLRVIDPSIPPHIAEAVIRAMAKDPANRFQSARDFAKALGEHSPRRHNVAPVRTSVPEIEPDAARASAVPDMVAPRTSGGAAWKAALGCAILSIPLLVIAGLAGFAIASGDGSPPLFKRASESSSTLGELVECREYEESACSCVGPNAATICLDARSRITTLRELVEGQPDQHDAIDRWCEDARGRNVCEPSEDAPAPGPPAREVPFGHTPGVLEPEDARRRGSIPVDRFEVELTRGERVNVRMTSDDFDPYLILRSPSNDILAINDDGSNLRGGRAAQLRYTPRRTGTYVVEATAARGEEGGEYQLRIDGARMGGSDSGGDARRQRRRDARRDRRRGELPQGGRWTNERVREL